MGMLPGHFPLGLDDKGLVHAGPPVLGSTPGKEAATTARDGARVHGAFLGIFNVNFHAGCLGHSSGVAVDFPLAAVHNGEGQGGGGQGPHKNPLG